MSNINFKPIQATPELSGRDVDKIVKQVLKKPTKCEEERNKAILTIFKNLKK